MSHNWELTGDRYPHLGDVGRSETALMVLPDNGTALHMRFPALNSNGVSQNPQIQLKPCPAEALPIMKVIAGFF